MTALSWDQVIAWRLARQHLVDRLPASSIERIADDIGGVHAQLGLGAESSLRARTRDLLPADVRAAVNDRRSLVKTWAMRGTLHLISAEQLPLVVAARGVRQAYRRPYWQKSFDVTNDELDAMFAATRVALDGHQLTREELADAIAEQVDARFAQRLRSGWGSLLKPCADEGLLVFGPSQGARVTFVRPDQWVPGWPATLPDPQESLLEVARRYIHAYGPTTGADFARWWGTETAAGNRVVKALEPELEAIEVDGSHAWALASDIGALAATKPQRGGHTVRLLPSFDPFVMGTYPRTAIVAEDRQLDVYRRVGAWVSPVVLVDGRAVGTWSQARQGRRLEISMTPFGRLPRPSAAGIRAEVADLGRFLDADATLVTAGVTS
jgi:hypothetical protein